MSAPDVLGEATRALREVANGESDRADDTRDRLLRTLEGRRRRRRHSTLVLSVFIVTLTASTSLAALDGSLQEVIGDLMVVVASARRPPVELASAERRTGQAVVRRRVPVAAPPNTPAPEPEVAAMPLPLEDEVDDPGEVVRPKQYPRPVRNRHPAPSSPASSATRGAADVRATAGDAFVQRRVHAADRPEVHVLYLEAHRRHFVEGDSRGALASWERYLTAAPNGQFALEARYNRAISLTRLGRRDSAIAALRPFAAGRYQGYRQREAVELIAALEQRSRER